MMALIPTPSFWTRSLSLFLLLSLPSCTWNRIEENPVNFLPKSSHFTSSKPISFDQELLKSLPTAPKEKKGTAASTKEFFLAKKFAKEQNFSLAHLHYQRARLLSPTKELEQEAFLAGQLCELYLPQSARALDTALLFLERRPDLLESRVYEQASEIGEQRTWNQRVDALRCILAQKIINEGNHYGILGQWIDAIAHEQEKSAHYRWSEEELERKEARRTSIELGLLLSCGATRSDALRRYVTLQQDRPQNERPSLTKERLEQIQHLLEQYKRDELSPTAARWMNALVPGLGYLYVGQGGSAITSLVVNTLFIAATIHLVKEKNYAGALIAGSLEAGWYIGGINGAGLAAMEANEARWKEGVEKSSLQEFCWPILQVEYRF